MTLTPEQQQREDLARLTLESMRWTVNYVDEGEEADELLGRPATPRQACIAKSFQAPHGFPTRKVITGPSLTYCLSQAVEHEERLSRLKEDVRPVGVADAAVPVMAVADGDTAQTRRRGQVPQMTAEIAAPFPGPGQL